MNTLIIAAFATLAVVSSAPSGHYYDAHVNIHALSPIGPSGIVTGHGATGPSGVVTGAGASGPSGFVTGHGPVGPTGPAGHGAILAGPAEVHGVAGGAHVDAHINPYALSPIGPSGIVTGHGASGPSGVVTGAGAVGPSGIVTGHGPVGPTGPAGHGHALAAPALAYAAHALPVAAPSLVHAAPAFAAPGLALGHDYGHGFDHGLGHSFGHGLGLAHGIH